MTVKDNNVNWHVTVLLYLLNIVVIITGYLINRSINQIDYKINQLESHIDKIDSDYHSTKEDVVTLKEWKRLWENANNERNSRSAGSKLTKPEFILPKPTEIVAEER